MKTKWNKWAYILFALYGIYLVLLQKDFSQSAIYLGLALAFDPFDQSIPWKERASWQKGLLILHLAFVAGLFGYSIGKYD